MLECLTCRHERAQTVCVEPGSCWLRQAGHTQSNTLFGEDRPGHSPHPRRSRAAPHLDTRRPPTYSLYIRYAWNSPTSRAAIGISSLRWLPSTRG